MMKGFSGDCPKQVLFDGFWEYAVFFYYFQVQLFPLALVHKKTYGIISNNGLTALGFCTKKNYRWISFEKLTISCDALYFAQK